MAKTKDEDILSEASRRFKLGTEAWRKNREMGTEDLEFLIGDQWPEDVRQQRAGRPCLTINKLPATVDKVIGDARQNKMSIKIRPIDDNQDPKRAEVMAGLIRDIERAGADVAYQTALEGAISCAQGYFRVVTQYNSEDTFDQDIRIKRILNPMSVTIDPNAEAADGSDARWAFITEMVPRSEFEEKYPDLTVGDFDAETDDAWSDWFDREDHVRIGEYWRLVPKKKTIVQMSDGTVTEMDVVKPVLDELEQQGITIVRQRDVKSQAVEWYLIGRRQIIDGPIDWPGIHIPIIPVWGKETVVRGERYLRSLVRFAKDPQRMYNYWRSASTELVALSPKSPWLVTPDQIEGFESEWRRVNSDNLPYLPYNPQPDAPMPQRQMPPTIPTGAIQETQIAADDLKATTGIYDASLGAQGNETSGRAITARQRQSDISTYSFHDNLRRAIEFCGRILVDLIPRIYDTNRVIRIIGPDETEQVVEINKRIVDVQTGQTVIINDLTIGKYDVEVDVGPSYATKRMEAVDAMLELVKAFPAMMQVAGDLLIKNLDVPEAQEMADRMRRIMPPQLLGEAPPRQQVPNAMQPQQAMSAPPGQAPTQGPPAGGGIPAGGPPPQPGLARQVPPELLAMMQQGMNRG